ncbi:transcriptional regulator [Anopheles sinensis]|uniref:Transcriptional regulator n=1 Tax=Anopheles sinensis TaxID=74873 RepID=A0A084WJJ7_ANOSI|nr:transcriptional regulator [Anopheles sinensis]
MAPSPKMVVLTETDGLSLGEVGFREPPFLEAPESERSRNNKPISPVGAQKLAQPKRISIAGDSRRLGGVCGGGGGRGPTQTSFGKY